MPQEILEIFTRSRRAAEHKENGTIEKTFRSICGHSQEEAKNCKAQENSGKSDKKSLKSLKIHLMKPGRKCFSLIPVKRENNLGFWGLMRMLEGGVRRHDVIIVHFGGNWVEYRMIVEKYIENRCAKANKIGLW